MCGFKVKSLALHVPKQTLDAPAFTICLQCLVPTATVTQEQQEIGACVLHLLAGEKQIEAKDLVPASVGKVAAKQCCGQMIRTLA